MNRIHMRVDGETGYFYVGVTAEGNNPGRLSLSRVQTLIDGESVPFAYSVEDGKVRLTTEKGWAELAIAMPNRLIIAGEGLTLLFGDGKGAQIFMGGGSSVQDEFNKNGALFIASGVKLRFVGRRGTIKSTSEWNLVTLTDPDPRIYVVPDESGKLDAYMYECDFDAPCTDDGITVEEASQQLMREFAAFIDAVNVPCNNEVLVRAAYAVWASIQPDRDFNQKFITEPEYISGRDSMGTALLSDSVLISLLLKDGDAAAKRMCSFLKYIREDGLVPKQANNRMFMIEAELPLFGFAMNELAKKGVFVNEAQFEELKKAFGWWENERFCQTRRLFYYLHRYEPACCKHLEFADVPPEFAPDLNTFMYLWADNMAKTAEKLGKKADADRFSAIAAETLDAMMKLLWKDGRFVFTDIRDEVVCTAHPRAQLCALLADVLPENVKKDVLSAVQTDATEDAIFRAYALEGNDSAKLHELAENVRNGAKKTELMTVREALTLLLVSGRAL